MIMDNDAFIFNLSNETNNFDYEFINEILMKKKNGLSNEEAVYLLKWVVSRIQSFLNEYDYAGIPTYESLCVYAADLAFSLLSYLNIYNRVYNIKKMMNYPIDVHALTLVRFPGEDGRDIEYVIDPTFRQFLIKEKCCEPHYILLHRDTYMRVGGYPGYYLSLTDEGIMFGTSLLNNGFFKSTEENWKIYGDAFMQYRNNIVYSDTNCFKYLLSGFEYYQSIFECEHNAQNYTEIRKLPLELKKINKKYN